MTRQLTRAARATAPFALLFLAGVGGWACASGDTTPVRDTGPRPDAPFSRDGAGPDGAGGSCTTDADCSDGDACNGTETCIGGRCSAGTPVDCDDGIGCTADTCDIGTGACSSRIDDTMCSTGLICDPVDGCITPPPCESDADCDDGVFCNGPERCDMAFGCRRGDPPTCSDGIECTADACDAAADACASVPDAARCSDGLVCNGAEVCSPLDPSADGEGCAVGAPPVCDDGVPCTVDACDEAAGGCAAVPTDALCDDRVFCNGAEVCDPARGGCQAGAPPACEDAIPCTIGRCDAATDACVQDANAAACDDGRRCNGTERCDPTGTTGGTGCVAGAPIDCSDGMACTTDACNEPGGMCTHGGADTDGDTYMVRGCASGNDCDDLNPRINPGAAELCDGIDNDCSGASAGMGIDDGPGMECALGSAPRVCTTSCGTAGTQPCDGACRLGTCRAATETCNNCDDDGDGQIDEPGGGSPVLCRAGDSRSCTTSCGTLGTQTCAAGCTWNPCSAAEVCNSCDDDGDGLVDDGFTLGGACTAGVGECARTGTVVCRTDQTGTTCSASPGAPVAELCNGRDDDCDGLSDEPFTELGSSCTVGVGACRRTGAFVCRTDGSTTTCSASPGMPGVEVCNGIDDDCDMTVDDGADGGPCDGPDTDLCQEGVNRCTGGVLVCDDATGNITEACNGLDDNCNGTTDEGCACTLGMMRSCYTGPMGTQGVGTCRAGTQTCVAGPGGVGSEWGSCTGVVLPVAETCNGADDDCNGTVDNGNPGGGAACDGADADLCQEGTMTCTGGTLVCSDATGNSVEVCNGIDDDCNGTIDNGNPGGGAACDGPDGDACNEGTLNCTSGTLVCSDMTATNVEVCNNLDDNCNGSVDEGNPGGGASCDGADTDLCVEGTFNCTGGALVCSDATGSTVEVCGNGADDDCNPSTSDVCPGVPNDTCGGAIALPAAGGSRMDTLVGATANVSDCGTGVEVFYSMTVTAPSIIYLSTLGASTVDTRISYRGTSCPGSAVQCVDDSCGTVQTHLAQYVTAGTHYFAVHTYSSFTTPGTFGLAYAAYAAAGGTNTLVTPLPAAGTTTTYSSGAATGTSLASAGCITSSGPENSYYWLQCPSDSRSYTANMCSMASYDAVAYARFNGTQIGCNDDYCSLFGPSRFSGAAAAGAGVVQVFIDGYSGASGAYSVGITF